jgi:Tetratricopeptide repeat
MNTPAATNNKPMSIVTALIQSCICNGGNCASYSERKGMGPSTQFVELKGVRFIGLGAVVDELTPRERVYDTLEVFRTKSERLVSIGYLFDEDLSAIKPDGSFEQSLETVPLDVWIRDFPDANGISRELKDTIELIKSNQFPKLVEELSTLLTRQKRSAQSGFNFFLVGITAHNLGVANILARNDAEAEPLFREAIRLKQNAFGSQHYEVALSWGELGIQLFSRGDFKEASSAFRRAQRVKIKTDGSNERDIVSPTYAMTLNNVACCEFQMGNHQLALQLLEEARSIQHNAIGSSLQHELDLLHVAIVYGNCGYLNLALKQYEAARSILEEALLIQQSVLDDEHRSVRDTLSNLEFANAFHS